jgi:hypothetical protein
MMMPRRLARLAPLAALLALAGCASHDDGAPPSDDVTTDEATAGATWSASGADEVDDPATPLPDDPITTAPEDSTPFLEPEDLVTQGPEPIGEIEPGDTAVLSTCQRATGYRSGSRFTICITHIDGKAVEVNTARAFLRMRSAAKKRGVYLHVVSGFRTMAEQRYLYHLYKIGKGNLAAPPGYSNHQSGHALDLNTSAGGVYSWLSSHAHSYAFKRTVPSEIWHWEHW